jgi:hypothetical protein
LATSWTSDSTYDLIVSEPGNGPRLAAGAAELLSAARFQEELRRIARYSTRVLTGDPLEIALSKVKQNPAFTQCRLLARVLAALAYQRGEFRRAELAAFDSETLALVIALMDKYAAATSSREKWIDAVAQAETALLGVR